MHMLHTPRFDCRVHCCLACRTAAVSLFFGQWDFNGGQLDDGQLYGGGFHGVETSCDGIALKSPSEAINPMKKMNVRAFDPARWWQLDPFKTLVRWGWIEQFIELYGMGK